MNANVTYDLDAPLPAPGADAVDDFLFESHLGFCEQIASALTIMLRTQGVPARLATGYLAGSRDRVAGVFEVRGSDAHAWVEVWFPETGWQAFDPTASVPLSGDAAIGSIGSDLAAGIGGYVEDHPLAFGLTIVAALGAFASVRVIGELRRRRRRGRWGLLQDRFSGYAERRGSPCGAANPTRAAMWDEEAAERASLVADRLDRAAFEPGFDDDDRL
jgi:hypothetical protein